MTYEEAQDVIFSRFKDNWDELACPIFYEALDKERDKSNEAVCSIILRNTSSNQRTLGKNRRQFERNGIATISIYTPTGNGLSESNALATLAVNIFEGESDSGLWYRNVTNNEAGKIGIYQLNLILIEFQYSVTK